MSKEEYLASVKRAKKYIEEGDIFQVVLSQRLETEIAADSFDIYRQLRRINPSPYLYYLDFNDFQIVGSSPELLVRVEENLIENRPIAGTRKRGKDKAEDQELAQDLLDDEKEQAEHTMLVDLGRNDVGKVSEYGSVEVDKLMEVEYYSHVMHLVSNVKGKLKENEDIYSALEACFPAGTVSGAPKIRAMEIIDELEQVRRGPYAGSIGYFGYSGNLDSCITIRTIIIKDNKAYVQAGAGIVADSNPEAEYQETLNKAKALLEAVRLAEGGENNDFSNR
jgi:anthranilate synthase component 1